MFSSGFVSFPACHHSTSDFLHVTERCLVRFLIGGAFNNHCHCQSFPWLLTSFCHKIL